MTARPPSRPRMPRCCRARATRVSGIFFRSRRTTPPDSDNRRMTPSAAKPDVHPYESLTPDVVLDALATIGLHGDGRLTALNSYENRVYQVYVEERGAVVVKFYRPGRWSEAAILEEHGFAV